jgi:hypothetical protein
MVRKNFLNLICILLTVILLSCSDTDNKSIKPSKRNSKYTPPPSTEVVPPAPNQLKVTPTDVIYPRRSFSEYIKIMTGSSDLTSANVYGNIATIVYDAVTPEYSTIINPDLDRTAMYWNTGDKIRKVLQEEPLRIFRECPDIDRVIIIIHSLNGIRSVDVTKYQLNNYYKIDLDKIGQDRTLNMWRDNVAWKFFSKTHRNEYEKKFIKWGNISEPNTQIIPLGRLTPLQINNDPIVCVSEYGKKYHNCDCHYLDNSNVFHDKKSVYILYGYVACTKCKP